MASGSEKRQLAEVLALRVTTAEREAWQCRANDAALSIGGYIRSVMEKTPAPNPRRRCQPVANEKALTQALAQLNKIGSNVNQMAHAGNRGNWPEARLHEELAADVRAVLALVMQALGSR